MNTNPGPNKNTDRTDCSPLSRRDFQQTIGQGVLTGALGTALAHELGLGVSSALADTAATTGKVLSFGKELDPLVALMEDTAPQKLQQLAVEKLQSGEASFDGLMRAAALANARSFGGADYVGMHTLMAMRPALVMARQLPKDRAPLVILKILHRNTSQIQSEGCKGETMHPVAPAEIPGAEPEAVHRLNEAARKGDAKRANEILTAIAAKSPDKALNSLLHTIEENIDVHDIVFAHRSWDALDLVGPEFASVMLRQSLRWHMRAVERGYAIDKPKRSLLPKLIDEFGLAGFQPGSRIPDDAWIKEMSELIFSGSPEQSARAAAESLQEGISPAAIGEAISLAANQLVLRDVGRTRKGNNPDKEIGSIHGDSIGVHASDAAHAWRGLAQFGNAAHRVACTILGAYQASHDRTSRGGDFLNWQPRPWAEDLGKLTETDQDKLLSQLDGVIREENQNMACAVTRKYGNLGYSERPLLDVLLKYAVSEDGALHGEKYYLTTTSSFAETRPAFRWDHLIGLARITASEYGLKAKGYKQACELLGVGA